MISSVAPSVSNARLACIFSLMVYTVYLALLPTHTYSSKTTGETSFRFNYGPDCLVLHCYFNSINSTSLYTTLSTPLSLHRSLYTALSTPLSLHHSLYTTLSSSLLPLFLRHSLQLSPPPLSTTLLGTFLHATLSTSLYRTPLHHPLHI